MSEIGQEPTLIHCAKPWYVPDQSSKQKWLRYRGEINLKAFPLFSLTFLYFFVTAFMKKDRCGTAPVRLPILTDIKGRLLGRALMPEASSKGLFTILCAGTSDSATLYDKPDYTK